MDKDYQNFIERMGSFEDSIDLTEDHLGMYHNIDEQKNIITRNRGTLNEDELKHFGKLGMKWGHHKAINSNTLGAAARTGQSAASLGQTINKNHFNKKALKDAKNLSDDELKKLTNRLNLENNYMNAQTQQQGRDKVERILATTGAVLSVAATAATLYDAVKKVKG